MKTQPTLDIAVTAAYFMDGLNAPEFDNVLRIWGMGHIELVSELCQYAEYATALMNVDLEHNGVFVYEVCEPFGAWFAKSILDRGGQAPTPAMCRAKLLHNSYLFFTQCQDEDRYDPIACMLFDVPFQWEES